MDNVLCIKSLPASVVTGVLEEKNTSKPEWRTVVAYLIWIRNRSGLAKVWSKICCRIYCSAFTACAANGQMKVNSVTWWDPILRLIGPNIDSIVGRIDAFKYTMNPAIRWDSQGGIWPIRTY